MSPIPVEIESDVSPRQTFRELMERVREGSHDAAWDLIALYGPHVRAVVRRKIHPRLRGFLDSEDFAQSVWLSFVKLGSRLESLEDPAQLIALLSAMAKNKVVDEFRKRMQTKKHDAGNTFSWGEGPGDSTTDCDSGDPTPSQFAIAREQWQRILATSPPQTREMLELRLRGATHDEIAAQLNICVRTVGRALARLEKW